MAQYEKIQDADLCLCKKFETIDGRDFLVNIVFLAKVDQEWCEIHFDRLSRLKEKPLFKED